MTAVALIVALMLLFVNGFFVAVEFAMVAAPRSGVEVEADKGGKRAKVALNAVTDLNRQVSGAQLGITMASLGLGYLAEPSVARLLEKLMHGLDPSLRHTLAFVIAYAIVVFLHMVVGEMVPKNIALVDPVKATIAMAPLHYRFVQLFGPMIRLFNWTATGILGLFGIRPVDERVEARTPAELASLVAESADEGVLGDFEHQLLAGAIDLGEVAAHTVAVPWDRVVRVNTGDSVEEIEAVVVATGHSRLPVVDDSDAVVGWLHSKELLAVGPEQRASPPPTLREMLRINNAARLEDVMFTMQAEATHFALVEGDAGQTVGIITLEDVLESVVGDIVDETDGGEAEGT